MLTVRFIMSRDKMGQLDKIHWLEVIKMDGTFHVSECEALDNISDGYLHDFLDEDEIDIGRGYIVDLEIDFDFNCEEPAYCSRVVNISEQYPASSFIYEVGYQDCETEQILSDEILF